VADTYINWGNWAFVQLSAADWDAVAMANAGNATSDAIDMGDCVAAEISIELAEDNTGAISGDVTVGLLRDVNGTDYEASSDPIFSFTITPVQNSTVRKTFAVSALEYSQFKLYVSNASGQELAVSVRIKKATIPAAS
jgi:hypothetical protein